jgi:WD40 repeat protein/tetratricopeptide (TPR) repeat protein
MRQLFIYFLFTLFCIQLHAQKLVLGLPTGHSDEVQQAVFSADGKYILTAGKDKTIRTWETYSAKPIFTIRLNDEAKHIQFHSSGKWFLVAFGDSVVLFDNEDASRVFALAAGDHAMFSADGHHIITNNPVARYDLSGKLVQQYCTSSSDGVMESFDGRYIASATEDSLFVYNSRSAKLLFTKEIKLQKGNWYDEDLCRSVKFSPDSKMLLLLREDSVFQVLESKTGKTVMEYKASIKPEAFFHPDSRFIVMSDYYDDVKIFDTRSGKVVRKIPSKGWGRSEKAFFNGDGHFLVVQGGDSTRIWDMKTNRHIYSYDDADQNIFSRDGKYIMTQNSDDSWVTLRRSDNGNIENHFHNKTGSVRFKNYAGRKTPLISSVKENVLRCWDPVTGKLLFALEGHKDYITDEEFSADGKYIFTRPPDHSSKDRCARVWNASNGNLLYTLYGDTGINYQPKMYWQYGFTPDSKKLFVSNSLQHDKSQGLDVFEAVTGKRLYHISIPGVISHEFGFSAKADRFVLNGTSDSVLVYNTESGEKIKTISTGKGYIQYAGFHAGDSLMIIQDSMISVFDNITGELRYRLPSNTYNSLDRNFSFSFDGNYFISDYDSLLNIIDLRTGKVLRSIVQKEPEFREAKFSNTGKYILTIDKEKHIQVWDVATGEEVIKVNEEGSAYSTEFSPKDDYLIMNGTNPVILNIRENKTVATIYAVEQEYIINLSSGYYQCSPGSSKHLYYIKGNKSIGFEQLDIKYNRPDLVIREMSKIAGEPDTVLASLYYKAYLKRLNRQQLSIESVTKEYSLPEAIFVNRDTIPSVTKNKALALHINAVDAVSTLKYMNIWINEVPLFGVMGIDLSSRNIATLDTTMTITLSQDENQVELSVTNAEGMESYRKPLLVNYAPGIYRKPKVYFVGIGVNEYKDSTRNLGLAVKDVRDLAIEFKKRYPDGQVDTFMNEAATIENIYRISERLNNTNEEDIVLVSFSGHGLLDDSLNFYCATYDIDFNDPSKRGLSYEKLEHLLENVTARKKLLLIDACNSGEADREMLATSNNEATDTTTASTPGGSKGLTIKGKRKADSYDVMRQMFANINQRNGLVVISAAGAKEYAFELNELDNGVFTYCFKKGLFEGEADADGYYGVTVNELKQYISRQVEILTNGRQKPTTRRENLVYDWSLSMIAQGIINSPVTASWYDSARVLYQQGTYEKAIHYYKKVEAQMVADNNYINNDYTWIQGNIAEAYMALKDTSAALRSWLAAEQIIKQFAKYSPTRSTMLYNIANLYYLQAQYTEAKQYKKEQLQVIKEVYEEKSREYAYASNDMGNIMYSNGEIDSAAFYYRRSADIMILLGRYDARSYKTDEKESFATVINNLVTTYKELKDYKNEAVYREELYYSKRSIFGNAPEEHNLLNDWAIAVEHNGDFQQADSLYAEAISLLQRDSTQQKNLLVILKNRAGMNKRIENWAKAAPVYDQIVRVLETINAPQAELAKHLNLAGMSYVMLDKNKEAGIHFHRAAAILKKLYGADNEDYKTVMGYLKMMEE